MFLQTRNLIVVEENAQVQITERHQNFDGKEVFTNALTEINAAANSIVDFYKIQNDKRSCSLIDNTWVNQEKPQTVRWTPSVLAESLSETTSAFCLMANMPKAICEALPLSDKIS